MYFGQERVLMDASSSHCQSINGSVADSFLTVRRHAASCKRNFQRSRQSFVAAYRSHSVHKTFLVLIYRVHDCNPQFAVRNTPITRHRLHSKSLRSLSRLYQELLLMVHDLRGISGMIHHTKLNINQIITDA